MCFVKKQIKSYRQVYSEKFIFLPSLTPNTSPPVFLLRDNHCHQLLKYTLRDCLCIFMIGFLEENQSRSRYACNNVACIQNTLFPKWN